ncbi:MAG: spore germination protein [Oscillospiraceae bacterium]|jgi:spore germination protein KB|nr:spore germination protein [Oscillospiraceae bacterium]
MTQGRLSFRGAFFLIVAAEVSAVTLSGLFGESGADGWISILLAALPAIPLILVFSRLCALMPGKSLPEMAGLQFGRAGEIIAGAVYGCFFIILTAAMLSGYTGFIHLAALPRTGPAIICLVFLSLCACLCRGGSETMGKWSAITGVLFLVILAGLIAFSAENIKPGNLMPVFTTSAETLAAEGLRIFALTHGELVLILFFAGDFAGDIKPQRLFWGALGFGLILALIVFFHNCAVLGPYTAASALFPLYRAASVIDAGGIGIRLETLVALAFMLIGITKTAAVLMAGARALSRAVRPAGVGAPLKLTVPAGFLAAALAVSALGGDAEKGELARRFLPAFILAPGALLPLPLWISAEIKKKRAGKKT